MLKMHYYRELDILAGKLEIFAYYVLSMDIICVIFYDPYEVIVTSKYFGIPSSLDG